MSVSEVLESFDDHNDVTVVILHRRLIRAGEPYGSGGPETPK